MNHHDQPVVCTPNPTHMGVPVCGHCILGHWPVAIINQITESGCKSPICSSATIRSFQCIPKFVNVCHTKLAYNFGWIWIHVEDPKFLDRAPDRPFYLNGMEWSGKKGVEGDSKLKSGAKFAS